MLPPIEIELTLEQQFELNRMRLESVNMSREQAIDMLLQASRLLMLKDNIVRNLAKQVGMAVIEYQPPDGEMG